MGTALGSLVKMILVTSLAVFGFGGCTGSPGNNEPAPAPSAETTEAEAGTVNGNVNDDSDSKTLVIYFSATGTTRGIAEKIASATGADLYEIVPKEPYSDEDLNYNNNDSRATKEQDDKTARPEFEDITVDIEKDYSTVFIGYPIWWGEEPRIMDTFVESYNFEGKTIIPFCTSGSSDISASSRNLEAKAGTGNWLSGSRFSASTSAEEIKTWIAGLGLN
ncbi:MAG: flavodoxin [Clostridia bacterium]|nr:flavodoxin [Clostridia bacterium]